MNRSFRKSRAGAGAVLAGSKVQGRSEFGYRMSVGAEGRDLLHSSGGVGLRGKVRGLFKEAYQ